MPLMVLACQMCPKQVESTFYALVMAIINLGYLVSYWIGGLLTIWLGISSEDFSRFWILILISSLWPLVTLLYLTCLPKESRLGLQSVNEQVRDNLLRRKEHLDSLEEQGVILDREERRFNSSDDLRLNRTTSSLLIKTNIRDSIDIAEELVEE